MQDCRTPHPTQLPADQHAPLLTLLPRRALKAAQQLDREPAEAEGQQGPPAARAAAVAKLEQVAAELPAPGDDAHLLCSPIKLRPQLPELQAHAQAAEQH